MAQGFHYRPETVSTQSSIASVIPDRNPSQAVRGQRSGLRPVTSDPKGEGRSIHRLSHAIVPDMTGNELLDDEMWEAYHALADRVVPADEFPGAWEAGAREFLSKQLGSDLSYLREPVVRAIDAVNTAAQRYEEACFADLDGTRQDAIIEALEESDDEAERRNMKLLIELTLESYYSNPENGGNRDEVSWKMIGYTRRPGRPLGRKGGRS